MNRTPYTYRITFLPTNKYYYGVRYAKGCHPNDLWEIYFTSSKIVHDLIKKYGKDSFKKEIRKVFDSADAAREWEYKVLTRIKNFVNVLNEHDGKAPSILACKKGAAIAVEKNRKQKTGLFDPKIRELACQSEIRIKNSIKTRKDRKLGFFSKDVQSKGGKKGSIKTNDPNNPNGINNPNHPTFKKRCDNSSDRMKINCLTGSDANRGRMREKGATKKQIQKWDNQKGKPGFMKGKKYKERTCPYCNQIGSGGNMTRFHFDNCKDKIRGVVGVNSYDIDGVIFLSNSIVGLYPRKKDIIITGRSFEEKEETKKMLERFGIKNKVYMNPLSFGDKTRESSGEHKANILKKLQEDGIIINVHWEDDPIQAEVIRRKCPGVNVIMVVHDLTEKENVRHTADEEIEGH